MPRPRKPIPSYSLHKPSGQARARVDGRDVYLGPYGSPESRDAYARLIAEISTGQQSPRTASSTAQALTVAEAILAYYQHASRHYAPRERATCELDNIRAALRPVRQLYGREPLSNFGPTAFEAVRQSMIQADLARGTINSYMARVLRWARWCVARELAPADLHHRLKAMDSLRPGHPGVRESPPVLPVPEQHVEAVLAHVRPPVAAMIRLQQLTGMRPGEVITMTTGPIDRSGEVWVYRPGRHKTKHRGKRRDIYIGPKAREILSAWLKADPDAPLFSPIEDDLAHQAERREARQSPMTPSQAQRRRRSKRGRPPRETYSVRSYAQAITRACLAAGVPPWGPNRLRHAAATRFRREYGLEAAQVLLGHSRATTTEIYALPDESKARAIVGDVG